MNILVLNSGSSSIKYSYFVDGVVSKAENIERVTDYAAAISKILGEVGSVDAVGHRVVHGGESYTEPTRITPEVVARIRELIALAPLHNPANLAGIEAVAKALPDVPQVAVFDTAFHQTMPDYAFMYALPYKLYEESHIRRYGFHGTSHHYIAEQASAYLGKPLSALNLITFHLGNGDSVCAIEHGKSVDTSMGFTPLEGLMMGTRSGDIDPEIVLYLQNHKNMSASEVDKMLNKESGFKGICGANDVREVYGKARAGDEKAILALEMFIYHAKKYLGAYMAVLGRVDAIVFTGGIGEHASDIRYHICKNLEFWNIHIDGAKNAHELPTTFEVSSPESKTKVLVVHTNEELAIAEATAKVLHG